MALNKIPYSSCGTLLCTTSSYKLKANLNQAGQVAALLWGKETCILRTRAAHVQQRRKL